MLDSIYFRLRNCSIAYNQIIVFDRCFMSKIPPKIANKPTTILIIPVQEYTLLIISFYIINKFVYKISQISSNFL